MEASIFVPGKFLVSSENSLAAEICASIQSVIADEAATITTSPLYVKGLLSRTTAPHGLTTAEVKRLFGGAHCMATQRRQTWFATLGDGLQDMTVSDARAIADAFSKVLVVEQKSHGLPQFWLQVWECGGGHHVHVVFIGNPAIVERLRNSGRFGRYLYVRRVNDAPRLPIYLSKERTPQTQYGIGAHIGGARKRGSHRLPGGGDRVRLSEALKSTALDAGYIEPWKPSNAKRKETRAASRPYRIRPGKAPKLTGQVVLFPHLERQTARLRDFHGGLMSPSQAREAEFHRQRQGISQDQLAHLIGLSQPHYANVVRGHDSMSRNSARRLLGVLAELLQTSAA